MGELGSQQTAGLGAISEALHHDIIVHRSPDRQMRKTLASRRAAFYPANTLFIPRRLVLLLREFSRVLPTPGRPALQMQFFPVSEHGLLLVLDQLAHLVLLL